MTVSPTSREPGRLVRLTAAVRGTMTYAPTLGTMLRTSCDVLHFRVHD